MERKYTDEQMMDILIDMGVPQQFLDGAICLGGFNEETFERVLFYKFGIRTFEDLDEYCGSDEPEDDVDESFYDPYMGCDCYD